MQGEIWSSSSFQNMSGGEQCSLDQAAVGSRWLLLPVLGVGHHAIELRTPLCRKVASSKGFETAALLTSFRNTCVCPCEYGQGCWDRQGRTSSELRSQFPGGFDVDKMQLVCKCSTGARSSEG